MTQELGNRKNAGKPRLDLIPWADIVTTSDASYTPGQVFDGLKAWWTGKPHRLSLAIPEREILGIAAVLGWATASGTYEARNWEKGLLFSGVFASAGRHALALANGEYVDPESGLGHASHFWCNVLFLAVFTARGRDDLDDRPAGSPTVLAMMDRLNSLVAQTSGMSPVSAAGLARDGEKAN